MKGMMAEMFKPNKYLIIVPHPDDEINVAGQLIRQLIPSHRQVYVLFTTNGDYEYDGKLRIREAISALGVLGVNEENIIFMGYGDDWKSEVHLYNAPDDETLFSVGNYDRTYGLETHPDYRFLVSGYHHEYTRQNYKQDMRDVILDLLADVLVVVDFDSHPDHRCASLMFEEVMGEILKTRDDYKPVVLKKFAYAGVWQGPKDYYMNPKKETCLSEQGPVGDQSEFGIVTYSWDNRIRFEAPSETQTLLIKNNIIYKAAKEHKTQEARFVVNRICNADIVYWLRKTNSLSYRATVRVSSGEACYLNDFKLIDCPDVGTTKTGLGILGDCTWIPDKADKEKAAYFYFSKPINVSCLSLYESFNPSDHITNGIIGFDNGFRVETGPLNQMGMETIIEFGMQYGVRYLSFQITAFEGENPGLTEIEIYERREKNDLSHIAKLYSPNRTGGVKANIFDHIAVFAERCCFKFESRFSKMKRSIWGKLHPV